MRDDVLQELLAARARAVAAAKRITGCTYDAEDCVQAALQMVLELEAERRPSNPGGWLVTVSRRRAVDLMRRREAQARALLKQDVSEIVPDVAESVADLAEAQWLAQEATHRLPRSTQAVLTGLANGSSVRELAAELGLTERSVEGHVNRLRRSLRRAWAATLGVFGVSWLAVRRSVAVATPTLALTAVAITFTPRAGTPEQLPGKGQFGVLEVAGSTPPDSRITQAVPQPPKRVQPPGHRPYLATPSRQGSAHHVLREQDPTGHTEATVKDRGGPDDPVFGTLKCVEEFEVSPSHIGC